MAYLLAFAILALLEMLAIMLIFAFKDVLHAVLALSTSLLIISVIFALLGQPLLALLQLFVMVGGISTYLFVGVASASFSHFKHVSFAVLGATFTIVFSMLSYKIAYSLPQAGATTVLTQPLISGYLESGIGVISMAVAMLLGVGIAAVITLKKLGAY